CYQYSSGRTF
nr:immunoglobulin light chain junction region [Macaca mulatta]MOW08240.1 immunoglobulin light chain junction region [Macaca mulatta]MOW08253.1 immunoglobulin light chain junction region [Macaca mulatta]MOW08307.1 immunoglobulin light chain junction region [Macaca mulatta]MOW08418.1 immunoglobulin light chain junction region [Macaca mulatta]